MNIVIAHKFFHLVGGAEEYVRQQHLLFERHGHRVTPFSLRDERMPPSPFDKYFLQPLNLRGSHWRYKALNFGRILSRTLYSFEARRKMTGLVGEMRPDVAHVHGIENHISPSILDALGRAGVPIVQSVNNYKHLCASLRLYLYDRQEVCSRCRRGHYYHALTTRCVQGSLPASLLGMLEMYLHQSVMDIYGQVERFVVPNDFVGRKMVEAGHPEEKLVRLRNPFALSETQPASEFGDFILFFGRIEPEKGVMFLLKAMKRLPGVRLVVVGDGLQKGECEAWARANSLSNVEFTGPKWGEELRPYLMACRLVVVPSLWHEPSPYVIYQSLAAAKPVLACRMGGIPDLLTPETGHLVSADDVDELTEAIGTLVSNAPRLRSMGRAARRWAEEHLDPDVYYERIMNVYEEICGRPLR